MSDELLEGARFGWNVLSAALGAVLTLIVNSFRAGRQLEKLATKEEVEKKYVTKEAFDSLKGEIKGDLADIKTAQAQEREIGEKRFLAIMDRLGGK